MEDRPLMTPLEETRHSPLTEDEVKELVERMTAMAILYGIQMQDRTSSQFRVEAVPFTLFPSVLPRKVFDEAKSLQTYFQTVTYKVANNHEFMYKCFKRIVPVDGFIRALWNIYETVRQEQPSQISFMLTRNDFMMEEAPENEDLYLKQVEINTFAVGSGGMMRPLSELHRHSLSIADTPFKKEQMPDNNPSTGLAEGLIKAWELYNEPNSVILFVVDIMEPSQAQRWIERELYTINLSVRVIYRTFEQLLDQTRLTNDRRLFIGNKEVAVVYYRSGYSPHHYPSTKYFDLRLSLERSKAIKCPSIALHLAGCKKVQQMLCEPGVLEQFLDDPSVISDMRKTFARQVVLNENAVQKAKQNPYRYVLKPQREGGGNNLFDEEISEQIDNIYNSPEVSSWIMMDRIRGCCRRNRLIRTGIDPKLREVVSELGIFGVHIGTPTEELVNIECGYLLRTKPATANEGGIIQGLSCIDTLYLVD